MLDQLTAFGILSLINFIACGLIGIFTLSKNKTNPINISYFIFALSLAFYAFFYFLWQSSSDPKWGILLFKWTILGVVLINSGFVNFTFTVLHLREKNKIPLIFVHLINLFFCYSAFSLFYTDWKIKYTYGLWPIPSIVFHCYLVWWFLQVIFCFYIIYTKGYLKSTGKQKKQFQWILIATLIGYIGGGTNWFVWYGINFPPYLNSGVAIYASLLAYAILRHQLFDIDVIVKKTIVFTGLVSFVFGVYSLASYFAQEVLVRFVPVGKFAAGFISVLFIVFGYEPLRKFLTNTTDRFLFQKAIDYNKIERDISNQIQITELSTQLRNIVDIFKNGFQLENASILLLDEEKKIYRLSYRIDGIGKYEDKSELPQDDISIRWLLETSKNVLLKNTFSENKYAITQMGFFSSWEAEAICKIIFQESVIAILLLGKKKSDEDFGERDIDFFDKISKSLGVSINNARSFKVKEEFMLLMAEKNKTDVLARLSEGIDHEIKNPLNAIKPAITRVEMMLKKDKYPQPKAIEYLAMASRNTDRIVSIMTRLRQFARPIRDQGDFNLEPIQLRSIINEVNEMVRNQLELDQVVVENNVGEDIRIFGEKSILYQIFWNLINNAYHAINRDGKITINARLSENDGKIIVEVVDTGKGIPQEIKGKIFAPFFTTKPTNLPPDGSQRFTGTGLGLCTVKQYIENLGGSISFDSEEGKGTTFFMKYLRASSDAKKV